MSEGLETTLRFLSQTKNEAAVGILIPALDSAHLEIQEGALLALLDRHSDAGSREVVRRLHRINARWEAIIDAHHARLTGALRDAVLATQPQLCANGCRGVLWFREYDLIPALITAAEDESNPNRDLTAATLLKLAELLYEELAAPRDYRNRRDPQLVRRHVLGNLEHAVRRFPRHQLVTIVEAFLLLVHRDNVTLKQILLDPLDPCYRPLVDILSHGSRSGVIRLLLSFLDDPRMPSSAVTILAHRGDARFVEALMRKIGVDPSPAMVANLKRIENVAWLQSEPALLERLDESGQYAAVQLAMRSGMNRKAVLKMLDFLIHRGNEGGRKAASAALEQFSGVEANTLCLKALDDPCPEVKANALRQLRTRGIPGALSRLVELIESPHEVVRSAVRDSLAEFNFKRYLAAYDMLDEEVRRSTGGMVRKIDPQAVPLLKAELTAKSRTRRLRAITVTCSMGAVPDVETEMLERLTDEDHVVRAEAARALAACNTPATWKALDDARGDRSIAVKEAAEESLFELQEAGLRTGASRRASPFLMFATPLLAQIDKWREMGREFQTDRPKLGLGTVIASIAVLAVVIVFLWLLARLMNRQEGRRLFNNPKQLFRSLCRAHHLNRADRRLLARIGRLRRLPQPASLFLEPEHLDRAWENPACRGEQAAIKRLRARLFGELQTVAVGAPPEEPIARSS